MQCLLQVSFDATKVELRAKVAARIAHIHLALAQNWIYLQYKTVCTKLLGVESDHFGLVQLLSCCYPRILKPVAWVAPRGFADGDTGIN